MGNLQDQISRIHNELVAKASALGKSVAAHAATELAQAHINWQRVCVVVAAAAFVVGALVGYNVHA